MIMFSTPRRIFKIVKKKKRKKEKKKRGSLEDHFIFLRKKLFLRQKLDGRLHIKIKLT